MYRFFISRETRFFISNPTTPRSLKLTKRWVRLSLTFLFACFFFSSPSPGFRLVFFKIQLLMLQRLKLQCKNINVDIICDISNETNVARMEVLISFCVCACGGVGLKSLGGTIPTITRPRSNPVDLTHSPKKKGSPRVVRTCNIAFPLFLRPHHHRPIGIIICI